MARRDKWGTHAAYLCDGEFGDGFWRVFTCEPCWPPNGADTWTFNGGPAFDTQEHAEKYLRTLEREAA